jgi:phospholipid-transporting ATPase
MCCDLEVPFEILHVLEFNSDRKRNSVVVRLPNGDIRIYSKGADATMKPLLSSSSQALLTTTIEHMCDFATEGLRTMVVASRVIPKAEFLKWEPVYNSSLNRLTDRQAAVDAAAALIEKDLELIGATAIEDKLQEGVPDCIEMLRKAGMKVWVLTGDKQETAVNIAFACKLLTNKMQIVTIEGTSADDVRSHVRSLAHSFVSVPHSSFMNYALVVEGSALSLCLSDELVSEMLSICVKCGVVVCCRVSPKQKGSCFFFLLFG